MGKYSELESAVFSIFGASAWTANGVTAQPSNFTGTVGGSDYIRIHILANHTGVNIRSVSGILNIDIFTALGVGPRRSTQIADMLDAILATKSTDSPNGSRVQCMTSTLTGLGRDGDNQSLYRALYSIPFNYYGK
jgi:hypothetical protein